MLDIDTKRRIDTARDILVGKVPDPKSQVEQITIALIYKFMDDMDAEAAALGGKRKFFAGDFERYGWGKLIQAGIGGHEMLSLYSEGISKMPENPGIPPLFREIFKNAYLPYRDPETLKAFLKVIDEFSYDHSERLGDAFEYLLSVLDSQGDAGQFRTPRHIIDFMVEVLAPQKGETVLDPACGTAGFLISAYKHILRANTDAKGRSTLTPDERGRLARDFKGYDISPDMVRLSLVNLYLHGFTDPHIYEYDTLSSEERWNEFADVILANPPFMSPKGGIKPHRRFSIQAKRSEVLFVDYMAEHLTPDGRAGIIVPEGIIFQAQTAYKDLRKMLVENALVAVVSLPAGCFNPYSGVKTSILILDKSLAKAASTIAFFKVENDGYSLGAQRRPIGKNDLPPIRVELAAYLQALRTKEPVEAIVITAGAIISKSKIAGNSDYSLSVDRYREGSEKSTRFPRRAVGSLVETIAPPTKIQKTEFGKAGRFPIIDQSQDAIAGWTDDEAALVRPAKPLVIFGDHTCAVKLVETPFAQGADGIKILQTLDTLDPRFLFHILRAHPLESNGYQRHYSKLKEYLIPLPPLETQKEIVEEIEGYQRVMEGAWLVLRNYRPHIPIDPDWPTVQLGEICFFKNGLNFDKSGSGYTVKIIGVSDFQANLYAPLDRLSEVRLASPLSDEYLVREGDILFVRSNGNPDLVGRSLFVPAPREPTTFSGFTIRSRIHDQRALPLFYAHLFKSRDFAEMIKTVGRGANIRNLSQGILGELNVPIPPLATQKAIVAELETEQGLIDINHQLISRFEQKVRMVLARTWSEETPDALEA